MNDIFSFGDFAKLAAVWDKFCIIKMSVKLMPNNVGVESFDPGPVARGNLGSIIDYEDNPNITSFAQMVSYNNYKMHYPRAVCYRSTKIHKRIRPELISTDATTIPAANNNVTIEFYGDTFSYSQIQYFRLDEFICVFSGRTNI